MVHHRAASLTSALLHRKRLCHATTIQYLVQPTPTRAMPHLNLPHHSPISFIAPTCCASKPQSANKLFVFGLGYVGSQCACYFRERNWQVAGVTNRSESALLAAKQAIPVAATQKLSPFLLRRFLQRHLADATHILASVPPVDGRDPVLNAFMGDIDLASRLLWIVRFQCLVSLSSI